jgi:hypothetical protein
MTFAELASAVVATAASVRSEANTYEDWAP